MLLGANLDDVYFVRRALGAAALSDRALQVKIGLFSDLHDLELAATDVLYLCNLRRLDSQKTLLVQEFVAAGGGLVIFPSPQADLSYYNRLLLPGLIPARFKVARFAESASESFLQLDKRPPHHPLFADLLQENELDRPRFFSWFELVGEKNLEAIIRFTSGELAVATGQRGRGHTVLFSVPLTDDWNDLAIKGLFAPLMHRLARFLSRPRDSGDSYLVGDTILRYLEDVPLESRVQVESPSGSQLIMTPFQVGGRNLWRISRVDEAGLWRMRVGAELIDVFAVNVDPRESDLERVSESHIRAIFGQGRVHFSTTPDELALTVVKRRYGREIWRECILLALLLLMLELWISRAPRKASSGRVRGSWQGQQDPGRG